jgi:NAD(P)-dependent dehydrogenase (short-subunit alcohol dehydrogenase family)
MESNKETNLTGKVALITGAGGQHGLGRAIAVRLAQEGADVAVNDLVEMPYDADGWKGLSSVVGEIESLGRRAFSVVADVSRADDVERMVERVIREFGHIDILVNNAGSPPGPDRVSVVELEEDAWDLVYRVNVKGTFLCTRSVARQMIKQGKGGKIINISSVAGKKGYARFAAYSSSKFAVVGFTQAIAHDLAPYKITVNALCPGITETERLSQIAAAIAPPDKTREEMQKDLIELVSKDTPMGRIGQPSDVANVAAFLASAESDYLTGLSIAVCGGFIMD